MLVFKIFFVIDYSIKSDFDNSNIKYIRLNLCQLRIFIVKPNVFWKELWVKEDIALISSHNPPSQAGITQRNLSKPQVENVTRKRSVSSCVPLGFISNVLGVNVALVLSRAFVMRSPLELIWKSLEVASPTSVPCRKPDLGFQ